MGGDGTHPEDRLKLQLHRRPLDTCPLGGHGVRRSHHCTADAALRAGDCADVYSPADEKGLLEEGAHLCGIMLGVRVSLFPHKTGRSEDLGG